MKKVVGIMLLCAMLGCRQEPLVDDVHDGRSTQEEEADSVSVTPNFEAEDWEESILIGF